MSSFPAVVPTVRLGNRTQISRKEVIIGGTQNAVSKAGRKKELIHQLLKKNKELARDMEFVLTRNGVKVTGDSTTAPQLAVLAYQELGGHLRLTTAGVVDIEPAGVAPVQAVG